MNISKQSWHYKVVSNFSGYAPEDFCAYSRTLLLALISLFVLAFGVLIIIPGILGLFVNDILKYLDDHDYKNIHEIIGKALPLK